MTPPVDEGYDAYFESRGWAKTTSTGTFWYYDGLQEKIGFAKGQKILEIGFGDSRFMDWSRSRGLMPVGVEILEAALDKGRALGHEVFPGPFTPATLKPDRLFDVIVAFDVVEHLTVSEIRQLFRDTLPHLLPGGRYLFRFPNGNSPFVGPTQNGDVTHRTLVSPAMIEEITKPLGLKVERAFGDRMLPPGLAARVKRRLAYALRSAVEALIGFAYFGRILPLDPNIFVIVGRVENVPTAAGTS
jgi:SAM-dependent methyltransferase